MNEGEVPTRENLELSDYLAVVRRRFWVIALVTVVVVAVTVIVALFSTPQYRSSAWLQYSADEYSIEAYLDLPQSGSSNPDREVKTAARLIELGTVADEVVEALDDSLSASKLQQMVSSRTETNLVEIIVEGPDPDQCATVANTYAEQFILFRQETERQEVRNARAELDRQLKSMSREELASEEAASLRERYEDLRTAEAFLDGGYDFVQEASVPTASFSPKPVRDGIVAGVLGLLAGLGLAFLVDYLDKGIRDEKALEKELGAPVLTTVPLVGSGRSGKQGPNGERLKQAVGFDKSPALLEAFRTLRSNLEFFAVGKKESVWLVTSGAPQEGKTTSVVNLALSMALSGKRVVVLEADLRRPMVHEYLDVFQAPGLSNLLAGTQRLDEVLQFVQADEFMPAVSRRRLGEETPGLIQRNLYAVSSGPVPPNPAELLASQRMGRVIKDLAGMCDCVIIDTPPVLAVSDAVTLARHTDGVLLVARLGRTGRDEVREIRDIFARSAVRVLGAVAVDARRSPAFKRGRGYGYGYGYGPEGSGQPTT